MKKEKLFYLYVVLGFILNIFIFPIGGLNFLKSALTALTDLDNNVEVKKVVIESDGYADKTPGSWHMEKSADWTSTTNAKIVFDVNTNPSFHDIPNFDVIMVLDVSTSMKGDKFDNLQTSAKKYINELLADENNRIAIVEYHSGYSVISSFSNDLNALTNEVNNLTLKCPVNSCTNYYAGLKGVETLLEDYTIESDRGLVVLFMTDGSANRETSMIKSQYEYLKDKYPSIKIVGIQYEIGSKITSYLKQASDVQYDAYMDNIYDHFYEATFGETLKYYDKFEIVDYIDNTYFEVLSEDDIKVSMGSVKLETNDSSQKVIWTIGPNTLVTSDDLHMEIDIRLKSEYQNKAGYYSTNKGVEVTTKLPDEEEKYTKSDKTPVLKYGYIVHYDGNYPSECNMTYGADELYSWYETVELAGVPPACEGYKFSGWKVESKVESVSDNRFIMPNYDVYVKGTWGKTELVKSTEGTVYIAPPPTLYNVMKYQSVPDNITSAYVTGENGIDFKTISSDTNGKGVYMIANTSRDKYPIYYYRGAVDNNNVLFADLCWKMVRTTETGGVKLIYNGVPTEQGNKKICNNTGTNTQLDQMAYRDVNVNSLAHMGYAYGSGYETHSGGHVGITFISSDYIGASRYYYSTSISYEDGTYKLGSDAKSYYWNSYYSRLAGYYTCHSDTSTTCIDPWYIVLGETQYHVYYLPLEDGKLLDDTDTNIVVGQNIQNNGNGTYTLKDTATLKKTEWLDNYSNYKNYYVCKDDVSSDTCTVENMSNITSSYNASISCLSIAKIKYGNSFTYDKKENKYTLKETIETNDLNTIEGGLTKYHYTCLSVDDTCTDINYVFYQYGNSIDYITISDGKGIEEALVEILSNDIDSTIKDYIENDWYSNNMEEYEQYLEDTVWCAGKSLEHDKITSGLNPNGDQMPSTIYFDTYYRWNDGTPSLKCSNNEALTVKNKGVTKPVGLITADEVMYAGGAYNSNNDYYLYTGQEYWTMSPNRFTLNGGSSEYFHVYLNGCLLGRYDSALYGVRPMISLKSGITYSDGDGTKENPYVILTD